MIEPRYAYLHGFASSSRSFKGVALAERFEADGHTLHLPDLNRPSFARLTVSAALQVLDDLDTAVPGGPWRLIGSSMGGFVASRWAQLHPEKVERLLLLCPGFGLPDRWPSILGEDAFARWEREGKLEFPDVDGTPTGVHWAFVEDARRHPGHPDVPCPTHIIHGRRDEVVPFAGSETYAASREHVELVEVDDVHSLTASLDVIAGEAASWLRG